MESNDQHTDEALARREQVERMYLQGMSQTSIATSVGTSVETVADDLAALRITWKRSPGRNVTPAKADELAKIDHLEGVAWKAWERSQRDLETIKVISDGGKARAEKVSKGQAGDPRFLDRVCWCIERRCRLLGLESPVKFAQTGSDGNDVSPRQARSEFHALLAVLRERSGTAPPAHAYGGIGTDGAFDSPG